ncbi:uncharacterized protein LOC126844373 [Adelges cooleyi]|uniref:uncharacterized protein LOC126844373 n=1 Tax=Adelges cooleyi TaxID=133065 RepID=UPI0021804368|nr:uncharacterized protein LOC126844373 [Adelges cooleyi]
MKTVVAVKLGLCASAFGAATVAAACFAAVWSYWFFEFDADCTVHDCKCILYGTSYAGGAFVGGEQYRCRYVWWSLAASAIFAACACACYGLALLCSTGTRPYAPANISDDAKSSQVSYVKICFITFCGLMALNMTIASIVLTNGYVATCQQYVYRVKSFLMPTGNMVELVSSRMSCETIYDFLDYVQPPSHEASIELINQHRPNPRNYIINTWVLLMTSIGMSWLNAIIWMAIPVCVYVL